MSKSKVIIGVVAVVLLGVVAWWLMAQSDDDEVGVDTNTNETVTEEVSISTDDWLTYENEEYGLTFNHPADVSVSVELVEKEAGTEERTAFSVDATELFVICLQKPDVVQECSGSVFINNQDLSQSAQQLSDYYDRNDVAYVSKPSTNSNGQDVISFAQTGDSAGEQTYLIGANGYTYAFSNYTSPDPTQLDADVAQAIYDSVVIE